MLRHHPDRATSSEVATRRTSILNRAWAELRDPVRRLHYDQALEGGTAPTLDWPLERRRAPASPHGGGEPRRGAAAEPAGTSPSGATVAASASRPTSSSPGRRPGALDRRATRSPARTGATTCQRYWLRYAARYYAERGRIDDWLGALERMLELEIRLAEIVDAGLRDAYLAAGEELRGAMASAPGRPSGIRSRTRQRRWADRELRVAARGVSRPARPARHRPTQRAENAELLLNFLESLGMEPGFTDYRAAIVAQRRARNTGRAAELVERVDAAPVTEPARWFSLVQLLTEAGQWTAHRRCSRRSPAASILTRSTAAGSAETRVRRICGRPRRLVRARRARRCGIAAGQPPRTGGGPGSARRATPLGRWSSQACARLRR